MKDMTKLAYKKAASGKSQAKNTRLTVVIVVAIIATLSLLWLLTRNDSTYAVNRDDIKRSVQSTLDKVSPPFGKQVYSDVVDLGCDDSASVGLAHITSCNIAGYRYFENRGSLSTNMKALDGTLTQAGWKKNANSAEHDAQVLNGVQADQVLYTQDETGRTSLTLESYSSQNPISGSSISNLINAKKIAVPNDGGTLFGVSVTETYWACRDESIFKLPCFSPPSAVKTR